MESLCQFSTLIVRKPCINLIHGITNANLGQPNYKLAVNQHNNYIDKLKLCDVQVEVLDALDEYPDSTFVEDVAICTKNCAIITNPGASSRKGEIIGMHDILAKYYSNIERIEAGLPSESRLETLRKQVVIETK